MSKKRKLLLTVLLIILLVLLVYYIAQRFKKKRIDEFTNASKVYYEEHMQGVSGVNTANITLDMLRNSKNEKYSIKSLKKCDKSSTMTYTIKKGKVVDKKMNLKCK